jgi:hypothetical protein
MVFFFVVHSEGTYWELKPIVNCENIPSRLGESLMGPAGLGPEIDCAGEAQQQL